MKHDLQATLHGELQIELRGQALEQLLNAALTQGIRLRGIRRIAPDRILCQLALPDLYRLRPLLRGRGVRLRRVTRGGDRRLYANGFRRRACKTRPAKTGSHFHRGKHRACSARRTHRPSTGDRTRNGSHRSSTDYARNDPSARGAKT